MSICSRQTLGFSSFESDISTADVKQQPQQVDVAFNATQGPMDVPDIAGTILLFPSAAEDANKTHNFFSRENGILTFWATHGPNYDPLDCSWDNNM